MKIEWDEDTANVSDSESTDEDDDENNDDDDVNDGDDEREGEPCTAVQNLSLIDDEEPDLLDDNNDFSVDISESDQDVTDSEEITGSQSKSYKDVGDNLDKNIRPSFQRIHHQTKSVHYFHTFAVKDRIDFSDLSESVPHNVKISLKNLLPGPADLTSLLDELQVIVAR